MKKNCMRSILAALGIAALSSLALTAQAANERWTSTTSRDENGNICIDFEEVQVLLPADWSGKCQMTTSDKSVSFYQTKSRQLWTEELGYPNGGWLFSIHIGSEADYINNPSYMIIGDVEDGTYYATFPTDLQAYTNNADAYNEFSNMQSDMDWVEDNISLLVENITIDNAEYIFPQSSSAYLSESDLYGMDADDVQMAINEIYARHHRKFVLQSVQDYFDSKSWYDGYIEADDFDVSVMNPYEGANINLLVNKLSQLQSSGSNITILSDSTEDAYGMIIESGDGYFRIRIEDGSIIQFWYADTTLDELCLDPSDLEVGAITSLIYDTQSYEAVDILIW